MKKTIGIDLGTGFSAVATMEGGEPTIISNSEGKRTTPSIVSFKDGVKKVGDAASRQRITAPKDTVLFVKRFMGVEYDNCSDIISHIPYEVVKRGTRPKIVLNGKEYTPEEISAMILQKMKETAEDYLGETVTDAVITCPAWFDNAAREATKAAGSIAGLNVLRVINEPTAAILAAKIKTDGETKKVLVADIGCGTTDFSVCELSDGMVEVLASKGDVFLGGSDFDNAIVNHLINHIKTEFGTDVSKDAMALQRIAEAAEKAKIELSSCAATQINLPYIGVKDNVPFHLDFNLTRATFDQLTKDLVERIIEKGKEALTAADVKAEELDCVLLVGGQTRSLAIQEALKNAFGDKLNRSVNPDEAVAMGAAIQADTCVNGSNGGVILLDVTPVSMGIETMGGIMTPIIEADTTIPCRKSQIFSTAADNQTRVDIRVLQGNRPMAKDNKTVGVFTLDGIMPAKRGIPQIEVVFDFDANGILNVSAIDKATNKEQHITIQSNNLTKEEIERMKAEAEANADADKKLKEEVVTLNEAESFVFANKELIKSNEEKLSSTEKTEIESLLSDIETAIKDKNASKIKELKESVNAKWNVISERQYGQANTSTTEQTDANSTNESTSSSETDNAEDAVFEEVK